MDYDNGFIPITSTIIDPIHALNQILEKSSQYNIDLHMLFIEDFQQGFVESLE